MAAHFLTDFRMANFVIFLALKDILCDHVFLIIFHESIETLHASFAWSKD